MLSFLSLRLKKYSFKVLKQIRRNMVFQTDEAIDVYKNIIKFPSIEHASVGNNSVPGQPIVHSLWNQRDLERLQKVKFTRSQVVQPDVVISTPPHEVDEQWNRESASGKRRAVIRKIKDKKGDEKQFIEIWNTYEKVSSIDVKTLEKQHGNIYESGTFGCLEWSPSEKHLLYVAEKREPDTKSFFDKKAMGDGDQTKTSQPVRGEEFVYKEAWGEQLTTNIHPILCILDVESGTVTTLDSIPEDISSGQAIWCADDAGIVCVGWNNTPYKLGLVYCPIRKSAIYHIDLKTLQCSTVGETNKAVQTPVFSADYSRLVWLQYEAGGPHMQCSKLLMCDWPGRNIAPVVDIVRRASASDFPGIFTGGLGRRCWANDNHRIVIDTQWRSKTELVVINTTTGQVTRLTNSADIGSWHLLDVCNDLVVAACSSPNQPHYLVTGELPGTGKEAQIEWRKLEPVPVTLTDIRWSIFSISPPDTPPPSDGTADGLDYECYLLESAECRHPDTKAPLAVYIHGGPHSILPTEFIPYLAGLCRCGYSVLAVNYRGSTGFGQDGIESLLGKVGTQDVRDVQNAVQKVLDMDVVDKDRVVVIGGSHGGFLTAHLIGQFPDFYKAAVCRNPVIDMCSLFGTSDIPDWVFTEGGLKFTHDQIANPAIYEELWKRSPIRYVNQMKTPIMIMLGVQDRRVPNQQGHLLRKALQARGVTVKTLCYPGDCHPIIKVDSEADAFINFVKWFNKYSCIS